MLKNSLTHICMCTRACVGYVKQQPNYQCFSRNHKKYYHDYTGKQAQAISFVRRAWCMQLRYEQ